MKKSVLRLILCALYLLAFPFLLSAEGPRYQAYYDGTHKIEYGLVVDPGGSTVIKALHNNGFIFILGMHGDGTVFVMSIHPNGNREGVTSKGEKFEYIKKDDCLLIEGEEGCQPMGGKLI